MESLEKFQQNGRVIEDFSRNILSSIPSNFGRLISVAMQRDIGSGRYRSRWLEGSYSDASIHEALGFCHEELLDRILEMTLEEQEKDLRLCLSSITQPPATVAARWLEDEFYRLLVPFSASAYRNDLFCSNLRVLLSLIASELRPAQVAHLGL
jgi:hypothetical protein